MSPQNENFLFRSFKPSDLESLISLLTDTQTMKFTGFRKPQTLERIQVCLTQWEHEGAGPLGVWAVEDRMTKKFIGWAMLKKTKSETPELGYMIDKQYWGQGIGTEIAVTLIRYAFNELRLTKVIAVTFAENLASVRILEKAGLKRNETILRDDGGFTYEVSSKCRCEG